MLIKVNRANEVLSSEITPEKVYVKRRDFMRGIGSASLVGASASLLPMNLLAEGQWDDISKSSLSTDEKLNSLEDITQYNNFYELGTGKTDPAKHADELKTDNWKITVSGECENPGTYNLEDVLKPHTFEERIYRLRCVEAWSMVIPWVGISLADVLKQYKPTSKAKYVAFETILDPENLHGQRQNVLEWPYVEGLRIDEAMHPLTILAVGLYGKELLNQSGAPIRLVVPWKYGFKSIKSIVSIRFTETVPPTSWNKSSSSEYGFYSNVNPSVKHPRWSQRKERRIGEIRKRKTLMFNGYDEVASLYTDLDLKKNF